MAVTVKTFSSASEAAGALSSDRSARYLGGGVFQGGFDALKRAFGG